nr:hypothetical protein [Tanacetum cinerariifolium]
DEKDPKEDLADYPADIGNNDDDESSNDDDDDDDVEKVKLQIQRISLTGFSAQSVGSSNMMY